MKKSLPESRQGLKAYRARTIAALKDVVTGHAFVVGPSPATYFLLKILTRAEQSYTVAAPPETDGRHLVDKSVVALSQARDESSQALARGDAASLITHLERFGPLLFISPAGVNHLFWQWLELWAGAVAADPTAKQAYIGSCHALSLLGSGIPRTTSEQEKRRQSRRRQERSRSKEVATLTVLRKKVAAGREKISRAHGLTLKQQNLAILQLYDHIIGEAQTNPDPHQKSAAKKLKMERHRIFRQMSA